MLNPPYGFFDIVNVGGFIVVPLLTMKRYSSWPGSFIFLSYIFLSDSPLMSGGGYLRAEEIALEFSTSGTTQSQNRTPGCPHAHRVIFTKPGNPVI
jgi:hypothetical protein